MRSRGSFGRALAAGSGLLLAVLVAAAAAPATAEEVHSVGPLQLPDLAFAEQASASPALRLAESVGEPLSLRSAAEGAGDQIEAMRAHNAGGGRPLQIGFSRTLPSPLRLRVDRADAQASGVRSVAGGLLAGAPGGALAWGARVQVADAYRLRLRLVDVDLPVGSRLWVWGAGEEPRAFGLELLSADGELWTPSVGGSEIFLEAELPAAALATGTRYGFTAAEVAQIFELGEDGGPAPPRQVVGKVGECLVDATCIGSNTLDVISQYRNAVAHLQFVKGNDLFACTGALLNDTVTTSVIPYFLTANHCFSTQGVTNTLEAFWNYKTSSCNGSIPGLGSLPTSNGGTLLASDDDTDFTLLRLNSIPGGRTLLGWTTQALAHGTVMHRISHPIPASSIFPQSYSRTFVNTSVGICTGLPRSRYIYSTTQQGGAFGGSSGAPTLLAGGFVVGQLLGACGPNPTDGCNGANSHVDGAFAATFPSISQFLNPATTGTPCVPDGDTLCIDHNPGDRRFKLEMIFDTGTQAGSGMAVPLAPVGASGGGMFWFFSPTNPELLVKLVNGCGLNNRWWVFYAATTNVQFTLTVTDTKTNAIKQYVNPLGQAAPPIQDTNAFATCP
jgi:hypothetical protein